MADAHQIRPGMQVLGIDGALLGEAVRSENGRLTVKSTVPSATQTHEVPSGWIARVDDHVHLDRSAALVRETWFTTASAAPPPPPPPAVKREEEGLGFLWKGLLALAVVGLLFVLLKSCDPGARDAADEAPPPAPITEAYDGAAARSAGPLAQEVRTYLVSRDPNPRSFYLEGLHFDTSSAAIRIQDQEEISELASVLTAHPRARIQVVGFADARGSEAVNRDLGERRAQAVAAALVQGGVERNRVQAASGGETEPAATNAARSGQLENRRTEIIIWP
jgi:outer membrane protein OmpA-like peptidoglycan-associated protein